MATSWTQGYMDQLHLVEGQISFARRFLARDRDAESVPEEGEGGVADNISISERDSMRVLSLRF